MSTEEKKPKSIISAFKKQQVSFVLEIAYFIIVHILAIIGIAELIAQHREFLALLDIAR